MPRPAACALSREQANTISDAELKKMKTLAQHGMAAAQFVIGRWQIEGQRLPKDVTEGIASVQKAADAHYGPALFYVSEMRIQGNLLPKDFAKGISQMREGAELVSKGAQFALGQMYATGKLVDLDLNRAKKYFRLCATDAVAECQFELGRLLLSGAQGKEREWLQAIAWLELAEGHHFEARKVLLRRKRRS